MRLLSHLLILLSILSTGIVAQNNQAQRVLDRYEQIRPSDEELVMYRLDWAQSFEEAKERARREKKPIFLIRIHAQYGDLYSGHC